MKFELQVLGGSNGATNRIIYIQHGEEHNLTFTAAGFTSARNGEKTLSVEDFVEINDLISKLPKEKQEEIYRCYERIDGLFYHMSFGEGMTLSELEKLLNAEVKKIYAIIRFEDLYEYVRYNSSIKLPPELVDEYPDTDRITPKSIKQTYLKKDYILLLGGVLGLRLMLPIWGRYIGMAKTAEGNDRKEYMAFRLLRGTDLLKSPVFDRMEQYIEANLDEALSKSKGNVGTVIFQFLSTDEIPNYLVALTAVRKLSIANLSAEVEKDHLIKIIYYFAIQRFENLPSRMDGEIKSKYGDGETRADDNSSVWCVYKMKEQISVGDLEIFQTYINDVHRAARRIESEYSRELLDKLVAKNQNLHQYIAAESQKIMAAWVLSTVVAGNTIWMFDRQTLLNAISVAQAVLVAWGFGELAILMTATPSPDEEDDGVIRLPEPLQSIEREVAETLLAMTPYELDPDPHMATGTITNASMRSIEELVVCFQGREWVPNVPVEIAARFNRADLTQRFTISTDIRTQLARLLIKIDGHIN